MFYFDYRGQLIRVIDGDTVVVECEQGLCGRQEEHLRLKNVDAPDPAKKGEPPKLGVKETTEFTASWFKLLDPNLRWPLYVVTTPNERDEPEEKRTFSRYEAMVYDVRDYHINPFDMDPKKSLNAAVNDFLAKHPEWDRQ